MRTNSIIRGIAAGFLAVTTLGWQAAGAQIDVTRGSPEQGQQKSQVCASCHGPNGVSQDPQYPNLAGQVPGYIAAQLSRYQSGERVNAIMAGMAANLSEEDMADLDAYYASLDPAPAGVSEENEALAREGESLYRGGIAERNVPACMACHGPAGQGIPEQYPRVSGQHAQYLETSLLAYKNDERASVGGIMNDIAFLLSADEIRALSYYMQGLGPR